MDSNLKKLGQAYFQVLIFLVSYQLIVVSFLLVMGKSLDIFLVMFLENFLCDTKNVKIPIRLPIKVKFDCFNVTRLYFAETQMQQLCNTLKPLAKAYNFFLLLFENLLTALL